MSSAIATGESLKEDLPAQATSRPGGPSSKFSAYQSCDKKFLSTPHIIAIYARSKELHTAAQIVNRAEWPTMAC